MIRNGHGKQAIFLEAAKGTFSILLLRRCYWRRFLTFS